MAINFPNSPINGNTYDYNGIKYTYDSSGAGFWKVTTPGTVGVANSTEINTGVDTVKYLSPAGFAGSKYVGAIGLVNNPAGSSLTATDIQGAIDALDAKVEAVTSIGVGQTWADYKASRASNTDYTNSTGRSIMVSVFASGRPAKADAYVDGVQVAYQYTMGSTYSSTMGTTFIVPPGSVYKVITTAIQVWSELR